MTASPSPESVQNQLASISIPRRIWGSIFCMFCGWLAMVLYLLAVYVQFADTNPRWFGMPAVFAQMSLPYVGGVWLFLLVPLFCAVPCRSRLWAWYVTSPLFAALGYLIMRAVYRFEENPTLDRIARLAALVGGVAGLASSLWQMRAARRAARAKCDESVTS